MAGSGENQNYVRRRARDRISTAADIKTSSCECHSEEIPVQGPPATAFAGPPATTQVVADPMDEYQKQLEEYNRKMAEYQAWQHAQGSQVTDDTTSHE